MEPQDFGIKRIQDTVNDVNELDDSTLYLGDPGDRTKHRVLNPETQNALTEGNEETQRGWGSIRPPLTLATDH